ncbi:hypothetical protein CR513_39181, partial [Mucuna pruriens]
MPTNKDFDGSKKKLEPKRSQVKVDLIQHLLKVVSKVGGNHVQLELNAEIIGRNSTYPIILVLEGYYENMYS